jgi:hypothetical protein
MPQTNVVLLARGNKDPRAYKPQPGRSGSDFWPTIDHGLHDMLVYCVLPKLPAGINIWEAATGAGHLVDALRRAGRTVIATDRFPNPDPLGIACLDFLQDPPPPQTRGSIMITNPLNSKLTEFLVRGLTLIDSGHLAGSNLKQ